MRLLCLEEESPLDQDWSMTMFPGQDRPGTQVLSPFPDRGEHGVHPDTRSDGALRLASAIMMDVRGESESK